MRFLLIAAPELARAANEAMMPVVRGALYTSTRRWLETLGDENEQFDAAAWLGANLGCDWLTVTGTAFTVVGASILAGKWAVRAHN